MNLNLWSHYNVSVYLDCYSLIMSNRTRKPLTYVAFTVNQPTVLLISFLYFHKTKFGSGSSNLEKFYGNRVKEFGMFCRLEGHWNAL